MTFDSYLSSFGDISKLDREILLREMDRVWDECGLDNLRNLSEQAINVMAFYSHNVWILNGLFSELDPVSRSHRLSMADFITELPVVKIADYGGGSGVLAKFIAERSSSLTVDIIEPFPSDYFKNRVQGICNINFVSELNPQYDLLIAQDVLEHVDDPVGLALTLIDSVRLNGYVIFANCFYPDIKCHLPSTFYLRHQFKRVVGFAGLEFVTNVQGASHAFVFRKVRDANISAVYKANSFAKLWGPVLNKLSTHVFYLKRAVKKYAGR